MPDRIGQTGGACDGHGGDVIGRGPCRRPILGHMKPVGCGSLGGSAQFGACVRNRMSNAQRKRALAEYEVELAALGATGPRLGPAPGRRLRSLMHQSRGGASAAPATIARWLIRCLPCRPCLDLCRWTTLSGQNLLVSTPHANGRLSYLVCVCVCCSPHQQC